MQCIAPKATGYVARNGTSDAAIAFIIQPQTLDL